LFALLKSAALVGTQCSDDEADFKCIQVTIAIGWKHLNERVCSDGNNERKHLAIRMKHVKTCGLSVMGNKASVAWHICLCLKSVFLV
jgi:hypothetical protein